MENKISTGLASGRETIILCRNSQGLEVRATPLRLTRYVVVFEIYNPYSILQLSEVLGDFRIIMNEDKEVGKRLDFLTQELNREANTITSKTSNMIVKENALAIKSEIEKIREQVQNVE